MISQLDKEVNETMRNSFDTFLSSLLEGGNAMNSFVDQWWNFKNTIQTHREALQDETLVDVYKLATVIDHIASDILVLHITSDKISNGVISDVSKILDEEMGNLTISKMPDIHDKASHPAYILPSFDWLLLNLHNPYPSKAVKKSISQQTNSSVKDIDAWFIDARKRIGWHSLRKNHFSNKQERIISAATRFFRPSVVTISDSPAVNYDAEFSEMEYRARCLYHSHRLEIGLAVSKDATSDNIPLKMPSELLQVTDRLAISSYPSPEPSPGYITESTPPTSLQDAAETASVFQQVLPTPLVSIQKRKHPSSETLENDVESMPSRPHKRTRSESVPLVTLCRLPSPAATIDLTQDSEDLTPSAPENSVKVREIRPMKRKRPLSDTESECPAKRPHNAISFRRLKTVSDPFPVAGSFANISSSESVQALNSQQDAERVQTLLSDGGTVDFDDDSIFDVQFHDYDFSAYIPDMHLLADSIVLRTPVSTVISDPSQMEHPSDFFEVDFPLDALTLPIDAPQTPYFDGNFSLNSALGLKLSDDWFYSQDNIEVGVAGFDPSAPPFDSASFVGPSIAPVHQDVQNLELIGFMNDLVSNDFSSAIYSHPSSKSSALHERLQALENEVQFLRQAVDIC